MLIQQTHFPQSGPNWGNIVLISLAVIATGIIIYKIAAPVKDKVKLETGNKT